MPGPAEIHGGTAEGQPGAEEFVSEGTMLGSDVGREAGLGADRLGSRHHDASVARELRCWT